MNVARGSAGKGGGGAVRGALQGAIGANGGPIAGRAAAVVVNIASAGENYSLPVQISSDAALDILDMGATLGVPIDKWDRVLHLAASTILWCFDVLLYALPK